MSRDDDNRNLLQGEVVLWSNKQWRVTNLVLEQVPEDGGWYYIYASDLHRDMWPDHMREKGWVDFSSFMEALTKARELHPLRIAA
ncbi:MULTISPECIES: hypothetical protein [unclassified Rhizobium]|uniref:hypothetical protein n=1 Tax=unclassified Rhizobium TaxID=2613769 RepID=UPI0007142AE9|nr:MULTISPECIES: hypothetical protein [unclassified Rhizobium]KQT03193.1 hypothetical protein ASG42_24595 [Rhizobium sp. Leaf391]KQU08412.1 hypothetical protein ASG68_22765 [Rhizobium sp. Leaf453]